MPKVLIVEDNLMIADMADEELTAHGYEVCGIARTVAAAVVMCRQHAPDLAVIDLRLEAGELGTEIPALLGGLGSLGVLYATGNVSHPTMTAENGHACLAKPYTSADLMQALEIVASLATTGVAKPPFPRGFTVLLPAEVRLAPTAHG
jgi:DNA-binding response OmpR family regulator